MLYPVQGHSQTFQTFQRGGGVCFLPHGFLRQAGGGGGEGGRWDITWTSDCHIAAIIVSVSLRPVAAIIIADPLCQ